MSEYADIIKLIDAEHETYVGTATIYIPRLRKALENENKSKEEIKDRILNDCEKYWSRRTIMDALGEDFKDVKQREAGQKGAEKKKQIAIQVSTDGHTAPNTDDNRAAMIAGQKINSSSAIPTQEETPTERAKRLMQDVGYDVEDQQIEINDLTTRIQTLEENEKRKSILLDKSYERIKELSEDKARLTAELEKKLSITNVPNPDDKENSGKVSVKYHKKVVGDLNTTILELKDKLLQTKIYKETIEIRGQRIVLDIKCSNLESIEIDELASRRLNQ